nr:sortase B cell surface sorting signal [uncultured Faecalimonas sp.]
MKTIKKWISCLMTAMMLCSMSQMQVLAEDTLPAAVTPKITEFKIQGVKGIIDDQQQKIEVAGLPCNTDLTALVAEIICNPVDAVVAFEPLKSLSGDGQQMPEQSGMVKQEDFSVPRTCTVEYRGQKVSYTVTVSVLSHVGDPATCTEDSVCKNCGALLEEKLGHDLSEATCTEPVKCQREGCDYTEGEALGHDLSKATCTEPAKCQREGCDYTEGEALGHELGEWSVTKESTTTEGGERTRKCNRCDYRETESVERLSRKADASRNQIADLKTDINYPLDETITFHLYGAGQDNDEPVEGDTRYIPESWKIENQFDWRNTEGEAGFQVHKAGFYKVLASFREQEFTNGTWQSTEQTDIKEITIKAGTEAQREEQARKDAAKKAAKTGDTTQVVLYVILVVAAAAIAGYVIVRNKKKKQ